MVCKPFRDISAQIELLRERGMNVRDEKSAAFHLSHISYYRLKGYWWDMQIDFQKHKFASSASFDDVISRYCFDKEIRPILFNAVETIEIALRTRLVYEFSEDFGGLFYERKELFTDEERYDQMRQNLYNDFMRSNEIFATDFKEKYGKFEDKRCVALSHKPESWIIFEVATFGLLSKLYKNLQHNLPAKARVANYFGLNSHKELSSWLEAITNLRNLVAHHSRVWNRVMVKRPANVEKTRNVWLMKSLTREQGNKAYGVISTMVYLCNAVGDDNQFRNAILALFKKYPNVSIEKLGFCNSWADEELWKE